MHSSELAYLSLVRRPVSSLLAILALGFSLGVGGWLLNLHAAAFSSIEVREPGIDTVLGPKSNGLSILLDGIHLAGRNSDILDYFLKGTLQKEIGPRLLIPLAHFAQFRGYPMVGTEDSFLLRPPDCQPPQIAQGRWFNLRVNEVVAGSEVARQSGIEIGSTLAARAIYDATDGNPVPIPPLTVVGILAPTGLPRDRGLYCDIFHAWNAQRRAINAKTLRLVKQGKGVTSFLLALDPQSTTQEQALYDVVHVGTNAQEVDVEEEIKGLRSLLGQGRMALAGVALLLVVLSVAISSLLFNERFESVKRDLGVLRALGYRQDQVAGAILWEGLFVAAIGICIGMVFERLGFFLSPLLWNPPWLRVPPWPSPPLLALWGAALGGCLLATIPPLIRLYRWDAHDALKGM